MDNTSELTCLEEGGRVECGGPVEYRMMPDNPRSFPRCEVHFEIRLATAERSLELTSPARPSWFDEANIGEHWDNDY